MTSVFHLNSCVRGYHIHNETRTAVFGETLCTGRELHNVVDRYAVAVTKADSGETVGHVPRKISRLCNMFIEKGGDITYVVTGSRRYSFDLAQGGLEIPCTLIFRGQEKLVRSTKKSIKLNKRLFTRL